MSRQEIKENKHCSTIETINISTEVAKNNGKIILRGNLLLHTTKYLTNRIMHKNKTIIFS